MKPASVFFVSLALTVSSFAALSPYNDTLIQFQAVLGSSELERQIHGEGIISVKNLGGGSFAVNTRSCQAAVMLEAHGQNPPTMPGGTSYTVKSVNAKCNQKSR